MPYLAPILAATLVLAQAGEAPTIQSLFEAGRYQQVIDQVSAAEDPDPTDVYLAGQSARKLDPPDLDAARAWFRRLADGPQGPWTFIGRSALAVVDGDSNQARADAQQAVELGPTEFYAQYQLGLAYAESKDFANAAATLEKATTIDPSFAYAHYYAGMSYYQVKRIDRMSNFFERFLKLAPEAPERPAIDALMRSIRK